MKSINIMLKPASGMCNLRCRYCFYADESKKRTTANFGMMSLDTLHLVLKHTLESVTHQCTIAFQGGEPTLAGLAFFKSAVAYAKELNVNNVALSFALQTNGIVLNDEWCTFFAQHKFLVGLSLDGTKEMHDENRIDSNGKGTYTRVMQALNLLKKHQVDTNILTVVTARTSKRYQSIYNFFNRNEIHYQQYIPCLDPYGEKRGAQPWSLTPEDFGAYLKAAFDRWYDDAIKGQVKYHRYFQNLLLMLDGQTPEACGMNGACGIQYVVEADGSVYPCDFYMLDDYKIGNLATDRLEQINKNRKKIGFLEWSQPIHIECQCCPWFSLCRGGCRRDRDYFGDEIKKNYYCSAYRSFFEYAFARLQWLYNHTISSLIP